MKPASLARRLPIGGILPLPLHTRRIVEDVEPRVYRPRHGTALADVVVEDHTRRLDHTLSHSQARASRVGSNMYRYPPTRICISTNKDTLPGI